MSSPNFDCIVMFADVVGSTQMYEHLGDQEAQDRISRALNTLIAVCKRHKGQLVKTIGDEIMVYFRDVDLALLAARTIQESMEDDRSPETVGISIKIGMHYGSVIQENHDIFGDTVNVTARIASIAKSRQILFSGTLAERIKSQDLQGQTRKFDRVPVKGKSQALDIFQLMWEEEGEMTDIQTGEIFALPSKIDHFKELVVTSSNQTFRLNLQSKPIMIGRDAICDIQITGTRVSRVHNKISVHRGKFALVDQSTNGTYVTINDEQKIYLRREELLLYGNGKISFGIPVEEAGDNVVQYSTQ